MASRAISAEWSGVETSEIGPGRRELDQFIHKP